MSRSSAAPLSPPAETPNLEATEIRVRGRVQGVGFRPTVWRHAHDLGLSGEVLNDAEGVLIRLAGGEAAAAGLIERLRAFPPPLARIEAIDCQPAAYALADGFRIADSRPGEMRTEVAPDAAVCADCAAEVVDPFARRFRYPFAACTHCGPRLSIAEGAPYDRAATTMAGFPLCDACAADYADPADRRFHAEALACHACGPRARLVRLDGAAVAFDRHSLLDEVDAVGGLLLSGAIVAIKGLGGYQLACDAANAGAVEALRLRKGRGAKPFALMARDLAVVRRYCTPTEDEARLLAGPEAPIVLMPADGPERLPEAVAPGMASLGFMLPTTPLHVLALKRVGRPVVMTSGNLGGEPQITDDAEALAVLRDVAEYALIHDRPIANRIDDSVVRSMGGRTRLLRRARGYAPAPISLPPGFEAAPDVIAMGGELKATFALVKGGQAVLSPHIGDLESASALEDYEKALGLHAALFDHAPAAIATDLHPEYLSSKLGRARAADQGLPLVEVQHHHAHVAACLAENGRPLGAPPVLGIALDGLGWGEDGTVWGGEFLLADYARYRRLACFKPVAMPGAAQAIRQPWRSLYAHLTAEMSWAELSMNFGELEVMAWLSGSERAALDVLIGKQINTPRASSCGRLFDAVAAALGLCRERQDYEGEAAARLEAMVDREALESEGEDLAYPFSIPILRGSGLPYIEPKAMWNALLGDLILETPPRVIAARFHRGLAKALTAMAVQLRGRGFDTVALSGGCFQNRVLFEETERRLRAEGFEVLSHSLVPANDGGLALGQAAVAAARLMETPSCA